MKKNNRVLIIILILNIIVYIFQICMKTDNEINDLINSGAFSKNLINNGFEFYKAFTCQFLHGGILHLVINMSTLAFLYKELSKVETEKKIIVVYIISIVVIGIALILFGRTNKIYIGNSGAITALMTLLIYKKYKEKGTKIGKYEINIIFMSIVLSILPGVSILIHFSGAISGIFVEKMHEKLIKLIKT